MSLVIRLTKMGKRGERRFRLVVAEKRSRRDGDPIDVLGWYEKTATGIKKNIDTKKAEKWISVGAHPSPTVKELLNT